MSATRLTNLALVAALVAALPLVASSEVDDATYSSRPLDEQATAAIPATVAAVPALVTIAPHPDRWANQDIETLKRGLAALKSRRIPEAISLRNQMDEGSLDRHILSWILALYGGGEVPSHEIARAARDLASWPEQDAIRDNFEKSLLAENASPETILDAFRRDKPRTPQGAIALARAHLARGDYESARNALATVWRKEKLTPRDEMTIIREFGAILTTADHRVRMEQMLYDEQVRSAERVAKLAGAEALTSAWIAVNRGDRNAAKLLEAVPADQRSPGYLFASIKNLRKRDRISLAAAQMEKAPSDRDALIDPDAWWIERRILSRELLDLGKTELAYQVAAGHAAVGKTEAADAEFHAGWYALRGLDDPQRAAKHFSRIVQNAEGAITLARANYWLGRAAEAAGSADAKTYYEKAARYGTTFYGQLAAAKIGSHNLDVSYPNPSPEDRQSFERREAVRAIDRLEQAGQPQYAGRLYLDLARLLKSPGELALLAAKAQDGGNHFMALKVGKLAAQRGVDIGALTHPMGAIPETAEISDAGKALAYAIARQESEFNTGAVSSAGALGLLQLMPGTAQELAKKAGLAYSQERLTADAGYNATLGTQMLSQQLERFDGSYILTFAAYNAGPGRANQWIARYGDPRGKSLEEVIDWIERIPFAETRSYVQRVMENYEVYKMRLSGRFDIVGDLRYGRQAR